MARPKPSPPRIAPAHRLVRIDRTRISSHHAPAAHVLDLAPLAFKALRIASAEDVALALAYPGHPLLVDAKVDELVSFGGRVQSHSRDNGPEDAYYFVVMQDPEGNEFFVA